jgi:rod shape-determining protein MreC
MIRELLARYHRSLLLALALVLPLGSLYYHGRDRVESSLLEQTLLAVTTPGQDATRAAIAALADMAEAYVLLVGVKAENRRLKAEQSQLIGEALRSRSLREELRRTKLLCGFREVRRDLRTMPARVVGHEVSRFFRVTRIRLEVEHLPGIATGQAVVTHDGVVGRIERVVGPFADVMLITDARSRVHASIVGKGVVGTVLGKGKAGEFSARFVYLERADQHAPISANDAVLKTGHDGVFPPGLELGHVTAARAVQEGLYQEYSLTPAVAVATVEEVLVVTGSAGSGRADTLAPGGQGARSVDPANAPDDQ